MKTIVKYKTDYIKQRARQNVKNNETGVPEHD